MKQIFTSLLLLCFATVGHCQQVFSSGYVCSEPKKEAEMRYSIDASNEVLAMQKLERFTQENSIFVIYSKQELEAPGFLEMLKQGDYSGYLLFTIPVKESTKGFRIFWPVTPKDYGDRVFYELRVEEMPVL